MFCDADRDAADARRAAVDKDRLAGLEVTLFEDRTVGGAADEREASGVLPAELGRLLGEVLLLDDGVLREGTTARLHVEGGGDARR